MTEVSMQSAVRQPDAGGLLARSYISDANPSLLEPVDLAELVGRVRPSNAFLDVTGVITCDGGKIHQWIEGPGAAVTLLWDRIRLDPRHRLQWASPPTVVTARHFPGSPMKLAMTTANLARLDPWLLDDVLTLPEPYEPRLIANLPDRMGCGIPDWLVDTGPTAWRLFDLAHRAASCRPTSTRAAALVDVLTGTDSVLARRHLDRTLASAGVLEATSLVQAVLDHLQAGWMAGLTSTLQRQLVLTMLQSALRVWLDVPESPRTVGCAVVSLLPGTPDVCGVMLKVALLRRAGWSVRLLLPRTLAEIIETMRALRPDLIVLAGSRLLAKPTELKMLTEVLPVLNAEVRAPVIIGGKLAESDAQALLNAGAAAVCGALTWISTIAAHLADPPVRCMPSRGKIEDFGQGASSQKRVRGSRRFASQTRAAHP